jgi:CRP/FNR family transcriptional regulator, anaerobic regulatory protein
MKSTKTGAADEELINELKNFGSVKAFDEGEILIEENSTVRHIPVVLKGSVKVLHSDDDLREILLYYLTPGDTCIMSFLGALYNDTSKVRAIVNEESEILLLPVRHLGELTRHHPEWNSYIFRAYHQRFQELLDVVNAVAFKKMDERLFHFLRRKKELSGSAEINITHEELAGELGTARVVVSRLLKQMEREGLVELGRNKISLL